MIRKKESHLSNPGRWKLKELGYEFKRQVMTINLVERLQEF